MRIVSPIRALVVVRHGRTAWNAGGRFQGHADPPLDDVGRAQSARVAAALGDRAPVLLVSSDLRRAAQTAADIARACGTDVRLDPSLRELRLGAWEGLTDDEAARRFPLEHRQWRRGVATRRGGGELPRDGGRRVAAALLHWVAAMPTGTTLVAVSHGLVLQSAITELTAIGVADRIGPAPHLSNGEALELAVMLPCTQPREGPSTLPSTGTLGP